MIGVVMVCSTIVGIGLFFVIFSHTKAGKRFFAEDNQE